MTQPKYNFAQDTHGNHRITGPDGTELWIKTTEMDMEDIRELLSGFGSIMQSIASHTWNKELKTKEGM